MATTGKVPMLVIRVRENQEDGIRALLLDTRVRPESQHIGFPKLLGGVLAYTQKTPKHLETERSQNHQQAESENYTARFPKEDTSPSLQWHANEVKQTLSEWMPWKLRRDVVTARHACTRAVPIGHEEQLQDAAKRLTRIPESPCDIDVIHDGLCGPLAALLKEAPGDRAQIG
jgi:hypothetical protein